MSKSHKMMYFEDYWRVYGVHMQPPVLEQAFKDVAQSAWMACLEHVIKIIEEEEARKLKGDPNGIL